jgi:hypothetical protein
LRGFGGGTRTRDTLFWRRMRQPLSVGWSRSVFGDDSSVRIDAIEELSLEVAEIEAQQRCPRRIPAHRRSR